MYFTVDNWNISRPDLVKAGTTAEQLIKYYTVLDKSQVWYMQSKVTYQKKLKLFYKTPRKEQYIFPNGMVLHSVFPVMTTSLSISQPELRPEQKYILNNIKNTWLIYMWTASGKTTIIANITAKYNRPTVILCHNCKAAEQMYSDIQKKLPDVEIWLYYWKNTKRTKNMQTITVTTHDTFSEKYNIFPKEALLIYDECDTNLSKKMIEAICLFWPVSIFWLTGTPYRQDLDTNDLTKIFWPLIQAPDEVMASQGKIWKYYYVPEVRKLKYTTKILYSEWTDWVKLRGELTNDTRILKQVDTLYKIFHADERKKYLVLTERVEEANMYYEYLTKLYPDVPSYIMTWSTTEQQDQVSLTDMRTKPKSILIWTAQKMYRGIDISEIDTICIFFANTFSGFIVQSVWRALRKHPDKKDVVVYDWRDHVPYLKHTLNTQSTKRNAAYKKEYWKDIKITVLDVNNI